MKISSVLLPAAVAGALLLTGCSGAGPTASASDAAGEACVAAGDASKAIAVKGDVGSSLELTSKTPIEVGELQRSIIEEGSGDMIETGQSISVAMSMFNGKDGKKLQEFPQTAVPFSKDGLAPWAYEGLRCATAGEQIALAAPYSEFYGETEPAMAGLEGIAVEDPMVIVMEFGDITDAPAQPGTLEPDQLLKKAEGKKQKVSDDLPKVKLAEDGSPTITMPKGVDAPEELTIATLIEGEGEEVQPGDNVYVHYRGVIWRTGEEFDSSWSRGEPTAFLTNQVIGGFQKALEGQKVGSQIISIVPAEDGGYGAAGLEGQGHEPDDVMVFVLDILGTVHAE